MTQKTGGVFQKTRESVQFFLIIFGASFGVYTFIYKDILVPAWRPPTIALAATLEELDRADGMVLVRAHLVVSNPGDTKVWVPALWWNVYGVSFSGENRTASEFAHDARPLLQRGDESMSRFSSVRLGEIVAVGRIPDHEYWYQPRDQATHQQLFLVPEGQFDAVQIFVTAYIFKSIDKFAPTRWEINGDGEISPVLQFKQKGWDKDPSRVVPFAPEADRSHRKAMDLQEAGQNFTTASLRIKQGPTGKKTKHQTKPERN